MNIDTPLAVISYAHGPRDSEVIALSNRLNREGVDCEIDVYDEAPPEGWPRRMEAMMTRRTVLVIASEAYYRRHRLEEPAGKGLGATFESGLLAQRVVAMQGRNEGIIPVLMDSTDAKFIPDFLLDVTRYDLSQPSGYDRLYGRLTRQRRYVKPPLGQIRNLLPESEGRFSDQTPTSAVRELALFYSDEGMFFVAIAEIERSQSLKLTLLPEDDAMTARLRSLTRQRNPFGLAYESTATYARASGIRETVRGSVHQIELDLTEQPVENSFGSEAAYNGISADGIAEMRTKRILLNERLNPAGGTWGHELDDTTLEAFVSGRVAGGNRLAVSGSPIPLLASTMDVDSPEFVVVARLACVLLLILSGAIEHVLRLDIRRGPYGVDVIFEGLRHKAYSNQEAPRLHLSGTCSIE